MTKRYKEKFAKTGSRIEARQKAKVRRRIVATPGKSYTVLLCAEDMHLLRHSVELSKVLGLRLISFSRRDKLKVLAKRQGRKYVPMKLTNLELKLLYSNYAQQVVLGDCDMEERAAYFARCLGSEEAEKIKRHVAEHERSKAIYEYEQGGAEEWECPEEDFDTYRGR